MKKISIILGAVIIIAVIVLVGWKFKSSSVTNVTQDVPTPTVAFPTVSDDIKVALLPKDGNKAVLLTVEGIPADVDNVEYELTYQTGAGLPRGVLGKIKTDGSGSIRRDDIVLGTCSSGHCAYDSGVTSLDLSLKFNSGDSSKVFHKTYSLI